MKKHRLSIDEYFDGIRDGNRVILSKAITLVESSLPEDRIIARNLLEKVLPLTGNSYRIGITGIPGVGKSTFIENFGLGLIKNYNKKVSVLAIDPTSQRTKGSILGDKTRMEELSKADQAFIRPSPAGDSLGGVASKSREVMLLCEAAGYDLIIIETVGVGQSETAVHNMSDVFLLLSMAGTGDDLQGIKKGIMEMADFIAINKADGPNLNPSLKTKKQLEMVLHMFPPHQNGWSPEVFTCSAYENKNIDKITERLFEFQKKMEDSSWFQRNRAGQSIKWMEDSIHSELLEAFYKNEEIKEKIDKIRNQVKVAEISPYLAADRLLDLYQRSKSKC